MDCKIGRMNILNGGKRQLNVAGVFREFCDCGKSRGKKGVADATPTSNGDPRKIQGIEVSRDVKYLGYDQKLTLDCLLAPDACVLWL